MSNPFSSGKQLQLDIALHDQSVGKSNRTLGTHDQHVFLLHIIGTLQSVLLPIDNNLVYRLAIENQLA